TIMASSKCSCRSRTNLCLAANCERKWVFGPSTRPDWKAGQRQRMLSQASACVRVGSFTSVRVCPLSGHCGHEFLRQGRDGPDSDSAAIRGVVAPAHNEAAQAEPRVVRLSPYRACRPFRFLSFDDVVT